MSAIASSLRAHSARASSSERSSRSTQRSRSLSSRSSRSTSAYAADSASAIAGALCIPAAGRRVAASSAILRLDISPSRRPSSSRALASICFTSRTSWSLTRARSRQRDDGSPASSSGSEVYGGGPAQRRTITRQSRLQSRWAASATRVRKWRVSICAIRMAVRSRRGLGSLRYQPHRARREQQVRRTPHSAYISGFGVFGRCRRRSIERHAKTPLRRAATLTRRSRLGEERIHVGVRRAEVDVLGAAVTHIQGCVLGPVALLVGKAHSKV